MYIFDYILIHFFWGNWDSGENRKTKTKFNRLCEKHFRTLLKGSRSHGPWLFGVSKPAFLNRRVAKDFLHRMHCSINFANTFFWIDYSKIKKIAFIWIEKIIRELFYLKLVMVCLRVNLCNNWCIFWLSESTWLLFVYTRELFQTDAF